MSLINWNPSTSFFPSISNWMDDFFPESSFKPAMKGLTIPAVNVSESKNAFKLSVAVPGFKKEDFKLEAKNGYLTISGETSAEKEDKDEEFTRREYSFNSFSRSFSLPENVAGDDISAQYTDGVLKVNLPKKKVEEAPSKQIAIK